METISNMTQEQKDEIVEYINSNGGIESRKKRLGEIKLEISEQKKELEKFEKGHIVEFVPVLRDENEKIVFIISDDEKIEFPVAITSVKGRSHKTVAKWLTDETLTNKAVNIYKRDFITVREAIELSISLKENIMTGIENEINLYYKCL